MLFEAPPCEGFGEAGVFISLLSGRFGWAAFLRAWCNGSIRVSKTFDLGSNPSARAN